MHEFGGGVNDGKNPGAALTLSGSTLFGSTQLGGASDAGTLFSINTDGTGFALLHEFAGGVNDGKNPEASLTLSGSTLFGSTQLGGASDAGTVFAINTDGNGYEMLHEFSGLNGAQPLGGLIVRGSSLFGTTNIGGSSGIGTVFELVVPVPEPSTFVLLCVGMMVVGICKWRGGLTV